ncbi:hypothetical protein C5167_044543 [Papaver somniferum]|uniref:Uncharacterized protein n=1 Tax=Papaver somniferum TaxID=3469 RepID=A0A4Y7LBT1_PAPSO|nr:hypothetical protein C5167_044543 [Papaver somniferum]
MGANPETLDESNLSSFGPCRYERQGIKMPYSCCFQKVLMWMLLVILAHRYIMLPPVQHDPSGSWCQYEYHFTVSSRTDSATCLANSQPNLAFHGTVTPLQGSIGSQSWQCAEHSLKMIRKAKENFLEANWRKEYLLEVYWYSERLDVQQTPFLMV